MLVLGEEGESVLHSMQPCCKHIQRTLIAMYIIIVIGNSVEKAGGERGHNY